MKGRARRAVTGDLVVTESSGPLAGENLRDLRVHVRRLHEAGVDCMVELAHPDALCSDVCDNGRVGEDPRIQLLLVRAVRPDRRDERSRAYVTAHEKWRLRGSARHD